MAKHALPASAAHSVFLFNSVFNFPPHCSASSPFPTSPRIQQTGTRRRRSISYQVELDFSWLLEGSLADHSPGQWDSLLLRDANGNS